MCPQCVKHMSELLDMCLHLPCVLNYIKEEHSRGGPGGVSPSGIIDREVGTTSYQSRTWEVYEDELPF